MDLSSRATLGIAVVCAAVAASLAPPALLAQGQTAAVTSPSPAANATPRAFVLSKPESRAFVTDSPVPIASPRFDPDAQITESLLAQKLASTRGEVGRDRRETVLFKVSSPAPRASNAPGGTAKTRFNEVQLPAGYAPQTGLTARPAPLVGAIREKSLTIGATFEGDSGLFVTPLDMQIAVGDTQIVQVTNAKLTVWYKKTQMELGSFGLAPQFRIPPGYTVTDPWVVFDSERHQWVLSVLVWNPDTYQSYIAFAVSQKNDALRAWSYRDLKFPDGPDDPRLRDQPKVALTDDKVIIAWDEFEGDLLKGGNWAVIAKTDLFDGTEQLHGTAHYQHGQRCLAAPIPAKKFSPGTRGFIVSAVLPEAVALCNTQLRPAAPQNTSNLIRVLTIDGLPPNLRTSDELVVVAPFSPVHDAEQKNSNQTLYSGDSRILSAIWHNEHLFTANHDACQAAPGCFKFVDMSTSPDAVKVLAAVQDFDVGVQNRYLLYPSLAADSHGHVMAVIAQVYAGYLGAAVFHRLAGRNYWGMTTIRSGTAVLACPGALPDRPETTRIGDYSGADRDPVDPDTVWLSVGIPATMQSGGVVSGEAIKCPQTSVLGRFTIR